MVQITEELVKARGVKPLNSRLYLDPLTRVLFECLRVGEERSGSDILRRLIQDEAARRGIWQPATVEIDWDRLGKRSE